MALMISWDRFINFEVKTPSESSWKEMVPPSYEEAVDNNSGIGNSQPNTNASVNSSSAHPPPPRATAGHLLTLSVPGVGHPQFYRGPGLGICVLRGDPRAFDTRVLESAMDEFIGKDEAFVEQCFLNFRYFFTTCKHINISDKVNYILFITKQSLTRTRLFRISHSKLA